MAKKNRTGNREPRKPKQPKTVQTPSNTLSGLMSARAPGGRGAK